MQKKKAFVQPLFKNQQSIFVGLTCHFGVRNERLSTAGCPLTVKLQLSHSSNHHLFGSAAPVEPPTRLKLLADQLQHLLRSRMFVLCEAPADPNTTDCFSSCKVIKAAGTVSRAAQLLVEGRMALFFAHHRHSVHTIFFVLSAPSVLLFVLSLSM